MSDLQKKTSFFHDVSRRDVLRASAGAGLLGLPSLAQATEPQENKAFLVKPYLQLGNQPVANTSESMDVMWHAADEEARWRVEFRDGFGGPWRKVPTPKFVCVLVPGIVPHRVFRVSLSGLTPGGRFEYRVWHNEAMVLAAEGRARKSQSQPVRCVVMGDCGTGSPQQKQVAYQISQMAADFVLIPGDMVYNNGLISEYNASFWPVYSVDAATPENGAPLLRSIPFLGGLGQHDTGQPLDQFSDGFAYYMYWSFPLNGPVRDVGDENAFPLGGSAEQQATALAATEDRYPRMANYSFEYGDSHWTVLDTWNPHINWNDPSLRDWLREDLQSTAATWKFVSSYLPPFNSSQAFPHTQKMRVIVDILQEFNVDIVFSGYAHSYQATYPLRFKAQNKINGPVRQPGHEIDGEFELDRAFDGKINTKPQGILYVTTGGGGNPSLHSPEQTDNPATWQPFTMKYNASVNQFSDLQFDQDKLTLRQVALNGDLIDEMVITK